MSPTVAHLFRRRLLSGALLLAIPVLRSLAAPGEVDPDFNPIDPAQYDGDMIASFAQKPDGRLFIAGRFNSRQGGTHRNMAILNSDGTFDQSFFFGTNDYISCAVTSENGDLLVGGYFSQPTQGVVRFLGNGALAADFNSGVSKFVYCMVTQPDGKQIVGGYFTSAQGSVRDNLARLNADGSLDAAFHPVINSTVESVALQTDGRIVIGGGFTKVDGATRNHLARLHADGSLDTGFDPNVDSPPHMENGDVTSIAVQADGKILFGGAFMTVGGIAREKLARVNPDGSLDTGFHPVLTGNSSPVVFSVCPQTDSRILISGQFTLVGGFPRGNIARLNSDGSVDSAFNPEANSTVLGTMLQSDGKILAGGTFSTIGGVPRRHLARLKNDAATEDLIWSRPDSVRWFRGGSSPETQHVGFDHSVDGASWTSLGRGTRISGGWELTGLSLSGTGRIRARASITGGLYNGSSGIVQSITTMQPGSEWRVEQPPGTVLPGEAIRIVTFGPVSVGGGRDLTFSLRNPGAALTGLKVTKTASGNPDDFSPGSMVATLATGATTSFFIRFSPSALGARTAVLQIEADGGIPPFVISLDGTGTAVTAVDAWRQFHFGTLMNTGAAADDSDPDNDGRLNLLECATGTHPLEFTPAMEAVVKNGSVLEFSFPRSKTAATELGFALEWADTLSGAWSTEGTWAPFIVRESGDLEQVQITVPAGNNGKRFLRLRVSHL